MLLQGYEQCAFRCDFSAIQPLQRPRTATFWHFLATISVFARMSEEVPKALLGAKNAKNGLFLAHIHADCADLAQNSGVCLPGVLF